QVAAGPLAVAQPARVAGQQRRREVPVAFQPDGVAVVAPRTVRYRTGQHLARVAERHAGDGDAGRQFGVRAAVGVGQVGRGPVDGTGEGALTEAQERPGVDVLRDHRGVDRVRVVARVGALRTGPEVPAGRVPHGVHEVAGDGGAGGPRPVA